MHVLLIFHGEEVHRQSWGVGRRPWGVRGANPGGFREAPHKQN